MAAGNFTLYNYAKKYILDGTIKLYSDVFKCALFTSSTNGGSASLANPYYTGTITNEVAAAGNYSTGGITCTLTIAGTAGTVTIDLTTDPSWASSTITAKWAIVYSNTATNKEGLGFCDLDTGGGSLSSSNGTFSITWNASGIFTFT